MKKITLFKLVLFICVSICTVKDVVAQQDILKEIIKEKLRVTEYNEFSNRTSTLLDGENEIKLTNETNTNEGEPYIAVNPNNPDNIVVGYMNSSSASLTYPIFYSFDGGENWTQSDFDSAAIFNDGSFPESSIGGGGDPIFAFDDTGRLYFSWSYLGVNPNTSETLFLVYQASSDDGGVSWDVADGDAKFIGQGGIDLSTGTITDFGTGLFDRPWFATDKSGGTHNGNLYVCGFFISNTNNPNDWGIAVRRKLAGSDSFEEGRVIVSTIPTVQYSSLAVDSAGNVHVTFADTLQNLVMHSVSVDGGETFSTPTVIGSFSFDFMGPDLVNINENPAINLAVDPSNNNLYIVWNSFEDSAQGFFSFSDDGGVTWSTPQNISNLAGMEDQQAYLPTVASNNENNVSISWYSLDANDAGHFMVFESTDGGLSWEDPIQISAEITEFDEYFDGDSFFGDYYTSDRAGCITYSAWSDGRGLAGPKIYVGITDHCLLSVDTVEIIPNDPELEVKTIYPNPVRDELKLEFTIDTQKRIQVTLRDIQGRLIRELEDNSFTAGSHLTTYTVNDLSSGTYFISVESQKGRVTKKIVKL